MSQDLRYNAKCDGAPPERMRDARRWLLWRLQTVESQTTGQRRGTKAPVSPFTPTSFDEWVSFDEARAMLARDRRAWGLGFAAYPGDNLTLIDLDGCLKPDGSVREEDREVVSDLLALRTYCEVSPSGDGLHAFITGTIDANFNLQFGGHVGREMFSHSKYLTFSGRQYGDVSQVREDADTQAALTAFYDKWKPEAKPTQSVASSKPEAPKRSTFEVFEILRDLKNGDKFLRLHGGDTRGYRTTSQADYAYCRMVRFVTQDADQIDALVQESGLARDKWFRPLRSGQTYGRYTIEKALAAGGPIYDPEALQNADTWARTATARYFPLWWSLRCRGERAIVLQVLLYLAARANENGNCWPSSDTISSDLDIPKNKVWSAIARLETLGILTRSNRRNQSNLYALRYTLRPREDIAVEAPTVRRVVRNMAPRRFAKRVPEPVTREE